MNNNTILKMKNITKKFSGTIAVKNVNFDLKSSEVHALVGENGAGKSTLMKILSGVYQPTKGTITLDGIEYKSFTPKQSFQHGISIIYQELSVINELTIAENMFLGRLPYKKFFGIKILDKKALDQEVKKFLKLVGLQIDPDEYVENLSISNKQLIEIAKALSLKVKILIMDEPTSSLSSSEIDRLINLIKKLKIEGVSIVFISHKLNEVKCVADRITVLKDGITMATKSTDELDIEDIIKLMVGRELKYKYEEKGQYCPKYKKDEKPVLSVKKLKLDKRIYDINFNAYRGEIIGFFGLIGAGRTEIMRAIFGADPIIDGEIFFNGESMRTWTPYSALKKGIGLVPENRREEGVLENFELWKNISLPILQKWSNFQGLIGRIRPKEEKKLADEYSKKLRIKSTSNKEFVSELSGGNQQKVVIAKWLAMDAQLIIFDEPTKGIDVGSKNDIYHIIIDLAKTGKTIILVSSETEELLSLCNRIYVMNNGKIKANLLREKATDERLVYYATI